jgi:hypothetical protein
MVLLESAEVGTQVAEYNKKVVDTLNPIYITGHALCSEGVEFTLFAPRNGLGFPNGKCMFHLENAVDLSRCLAFLLEGCNPIKERKFSPEEVKWVVNDSAELGIRIGNQCFFFHRGSSIEYGGKHDNGDPRRYRPVGTSEFGEVIGPKLEEDNLISTFPFYEGHDWFDLPECK